MSTRGAGTIPFVDLKAQHDALQPELRSAIDGVVARSEFILGPTLGDFEARFAEFVGARYAIGVGNGGDALRLALLALDVGAGDEVIVPANSYIATALCVSSVGARPILVDCDASTYNIDVDQIGRAVTSRTRAIIPAHLSGQAADMDPLLEIAQHHRLHVIEDAAQAHGATYRGRPCGSIGAAGCFSFYPSKNLGAWGDGGAVVTSDESVARRIRVLRNYGQEKKYQHVEKGWNTRLDTLQAAILAVKLEHLAEWNGRRARHAERYRELLRGVGDVTPQRPVDYGTHVYHLFMIETDHRDALQAHLAQQGIETVIHYPVPIHLQPAYAELGHREGAFPRSERLARRTLSLPMYPELTPALIERVVDGVRAFFASRMARVG